MGKAKAKSGRATSSPKAKRATKQDKGPVASSNPASKPAAAAASAPRPSSQAASASSASSTSLPSSSIPAPAPARDELVAPRDIGRLARYGERFGAWKIDTRLLQHVQLAVASSALAIFDPGAPKSWRVLDRPLDRPLGAGVGQFRVMLSIARRDDGSERLAAVVIHVGRPPIARWTVAHYRGQKKPRSADQLPRCPVTTGWLALIDAGAEATGVIAMPAAAPAIAPDDGRDAIEAPLTDGRRALAFPCGNGDYVAYWAVDGSDKPICLVVDFEVFTQKAWKA